MALTMNTSGLLNQTKANDLSSKSSIKVFNDLIETSKNLPSTSSELGSIQLSVNEIRKRANELRRVKEDKKPNHTKAHYLLAGSGLSIEDVDNSLRNLQSRQLLEQNISTRPMEGEIDTYLRMKKDESILSSIEQLLSTAAKDFDSFVNQNLNLDWEQRKEEVRENFGILVKRKNLGNDTATSRSFDMNTTVWGSTGNKILNNDSESRMNVNENQLLRGKFERYAKIIHVFNNARQTRRDFPLTNEIIFMMTGSGDSKNRQILESWRILESITESKDVVSTSKFYLEKQFMEYVDNLYKKNLNEGLPTNINKVKSFIDYKLKNKDNSWSPNNLTIVNGVPIWALIFYLLRAGLSQEALEVAINNKSSFKKVEQSFLTYFKAYISSKDHKLPLEFAAKLHTEYNQHIQSSLDGDPFRLAVYKIIGRCDLSRKNISSVTLSVEDWLWFHFMLIKDEVSDNDPVYERYSLEDFQNIIASYGDSRFTNYYLQVLVLCGMYELAIKYAYTISEIDGIHLAIGFVNKKLLNVTTAYNKENNGQLIVMNGNKREVNFARLLGNYTRSFKYSDPRIAAEYLILIGLLNQPEQIKLCHEAIRELVLETREFTILLGKINRDGTRIPGVIEERQPLLHMNNEKEFLHKITEQAAHKADEDGRVYDGLLLYQLSEEYDVVISIVNDLVGDLLSNTDLEQPLVSIEDNSETNPILIADKLVDMYLNNLEISKQVHTRNKETSLLLLRIAESRRSYLSHHWQDTLTQIEELDLIPFTNEIEARRRAQDLMTLNKNLVKNIPNLLVMVMTCIANISSSLNKSNFQSSSKYQQIDSLKKVARNCMIYAGMIQYKMPRETYSTLIRLDIALQ